MVHYIIFLDAYAYMKDYEYCHLSANITSDYSISENDLLIAAMNIVLALRNNGHSPITVRKDTTTTAVETIVNKIKILEVGELGS